MKLHIFIFVVMLGYYQSLSAVISGTCTTDTDCPANATCRPNACLGLTCLCRQGFVRNIAGTGCFQGALMGDDCDANTFCFGLSSRCNNGKCECIPTYGETAFRTCVPNGYSVFGENCTDECALVSFCNSTTSTCQCKPGYRNLTEEEFWTNENAIIDCVANDFDLNFCSGTPVVSTSTSISQTSTDISISETVPPQTISSTIAARGSAAESPASSSESIVSSSSSLPLPDSTSSAPAVATPAFSVSLSQLDSRSSTNDIVPSTSSLLTSSAVPTAKVRVNDACARDAECPDNAKCRPRGCLKLNCLCDTGLVANADLTRCLPGAMMGEDCGTNTICFGEQSSSFCNNGKCECRPGFRETAFRTCVLNGYTVFGENCTDECAFVSSCNSSTSTCQCNEGYRSLTEEEFWTNENALIDCVANDFDLNFCSGTPVVSTSTSISLTSTDISISETVPPQTISSTAATIGSAAESSASSSEPIVSSSSSLPLPDSTSSAPIVATPTFSVSLSQLDSRSSTNDIVPSTSSLLTSSVLPTAKVRVNDACARDTECPDNAKCRPRGCLKLNCLCDTGLAANADLTRCLPGAMMGEDCGTNTICFGQQSSSFCNNGKCECRPGYRETAFKTCVPSVFYVFGEPCTSDCAFRSLCNTSTSTCQCNEGYRNLTEEEFWVNQEALIDCVTDTYDLNMCSGTPVVPTSSTSTLDSSSSLFEMTTDTQATSMSSVLDTSLTVNSLAVSSSSTGVVASPSTLDTTTPQELPSLNSFPPESSAESVPISSSIEDPSTQAASLETSSPISASPTSSSLLVDVTAVDTITPGVSIVLSSGESPSATETLLSLDSSTTNLISSSSFENPTEEQSASGTSSKNPVTSTPLVFSATTSLPFASSSELSQLATQASESLQSVDSVTLDLSSDVFLPSSTVEFTDSSSTVSVLLSSREVGSSFTASSQTLSTSELQQMSSTSSSSQSSLPASSSFETSTETSNFLQITQQTSSSRQISPLISNSLQATSSSQQISPQISSSPQIAPSISSSSDIASQTASVPQTSPVTSSLKQTASESSISEQISSSASQPSQTSIIQQDSTVQLPSSSNIQTSLSQTSSSLHASPTPDVIDQQVTTITANEVSSSDIQIETTSQLQQSSPSNIESSTPSPEASSPTDVMESSQTAIPSSALTSASLDASENSSLVVDAQSALSSVPETQSISPTETSALESSSPVVTPVVCQAGSYQASDGTCQACQSGKYSNQPGVSDCTKCELGTYQDVTGQEDCKVCEKGSYQDEDGQIGCKNCKDGYTTTSTKTTDINDCLIECEVGQYRVNKDECAECEVGEYQDTVGSDTCIPCQDDYTTQGKGSTNKSDCYVECQVGQYRINKDKCTECEIGEYQDTVGSDTCIPCQDGFTTQTKGSISDSDCYMVCQPGSYLAPDRTCQACQTGTYSNQPGISDCTKCEQGTYQDVTGQQNCKVCEKGSYQDENGQTACKQCKDGYTTNLTKTTDASDCLIECKVGQYRVNKDECAECEIGEYQDTVGADTCIPCQDGFTTQTNGSTSDSDCYMACQPGSYQALDRTCKACQAGTYSNQPGVSDCTKCELGTYQNVTGQRDCKMCDKGSYQDEDGQTGCKQCKDGYTTNSSKTSDANSCIIECNVGQYRINKDECTECEIGKYQDTVGTDACIPCQDGFTTQKKGSTAKIDCVNPDAGTSAQNTAGIAASASIAGVLVLIFCGFLLFVCCRRYRAGRLSSSASESTDSTYSMKIPRPMLAYATYTNSSAYKDLAFSNSAYIIDRDRSVV